MLSGQVIEKARSVAGYTAGLARGGVTLVTSYIRDSEGLSADNMASIWKVMECLAAVKGNWLWAGDFNMEPQELNATGLLHSMGGGGIAIAPNSATCFVKMPGTNID
eukprot:3792268-Lingulodinium_polyedra.AAC.1